MDPAGLSLFCLSFRRSRSEAREALLRWRLHSKQLAASAASILVIGNGDEHVVVLHAPFVHQKIVVAAAAVVARIVAAGGGPRLIDRATALFGIEELADPPEVLVAFPAHQILVAVAFAREALLRGCEGQLEMLGEAFDVALRQRNDRVRAAVPGTIQTIIVSHLRL